MTDRVGFVGLGTMGVAMAANAARAGFEVTAWNRTPGRAGDAEAAGVRILESPAAVAAASDIVITMVSGYGRSRNRDRNCSGRPPGTMKFSDRISSQSTPAAPATSAS